MTWIDDLLADEEHEVVPVSEENAVELARRLLTAVNYEWPGEYPTLKEALFRFIHPRLDGPR